MIAYKEEEMLSVAELPDGFKSALEKLSTHQLERVALMNNRKPEAVILSAKEYEHLLEHHRWNSLDEESYLQEAYKSLDNPQTKTYSADELEQRLEATIRGYERCRKSLRYDDANIHELIFKRYRILYKVSDDSITVFALIKYENF